MSASVELVREAGPAEVRSPMIVFYSPNDRVVDSDHIEGFFDQLSVRPRRLVAVGDAEDPQQHVLAGNILSPSTTDRMASQIVQFVHQVAGDKPI